MHAPTFLLAVGWLVSFLGPPTDPRRTRPLPESTPIADLPRIEIERIDGERFEVLVRVVNPTDRPIELGSLYGLESARCRRLGDPALDLHVPDVCELPARSQLFRRVAVGRIRGLEKVEMRWRPRGAIDPYILESPSFANPGRIRATTADEDRSAAPTLRVLRLLDEGNGAAIAVLRLANGSPRSLTFYGYSEDAPWIRESDADGESISTTCSFGVGRWTLVASTAVEFVDRVPGDPTGIRRLCAYVGDKPIVSDEIPAATGFRSVTDAERRDPGIQLVELGLAEPALRDLADVRACEIVNASAATVEYRTDRRLDDALALFDLDPVEWPPGVDSRPFLELAPWSAKQVLVVVPDPANGERAGIETRIDGTQVFLELGR